MSGYYPIKGRKGKYELRVDVGKHSNGKRKTRTKTVEAKNDTEAKKKLVEFEYELMTGSYKVPQKIIFKEFWKQWREYYADRFIGDSSYLLYMSMSENYLLKEFGNAKVTDIKPLWIINYLDTVKSVRNPSKDLSDRSKHDLHRTFKNIMQRAVEWELIEENPLTKVKPHSERSMKKDNIYSLEEIEEVLKHLEECEVYQRCMIMLPLFCGLRRGEVLGLEEDCVDIENSTITIKRTVVKGKGGKPVIKEPKSKSGLRKFTAAPFVMDQLQLLMKEIRVTRLRSGLAYNRKYHWLFADENGKHFMPDTPTQWWHRFCERYEMRHITYHDLRHTYATVLMYSGIDMNTVAKLLGHSNASFTINTYGHLLANADTDVALKINQTFSKNRDVL